MMTYTDNQSWGCNGGAGLVHTVITNDTHGPAREYDDVLLQSA